jgi:hypothetical protein
MTLRQLRSSNLNPKPIDVAATSPDRPNSLVNTLITFGGQLSAKVHLNLTEIKIASTGQIYVN